MTTRITLTLAALLTLAAAVATRADDALAPIDSMAITGTIDGPNITFTLGFELNHTNARRTYPLIDGQVALDTIDAGPGAAVDYSETTGGYRIGWAQAGRHKVTASFAAGARELDGGWRAASFTVPASRVRELRVVCDRVDLDVRFPGALRQEREVADGKLIVTAMLGPGLPFTVQWKPQVQQLEGELVYSARVNTIARLNSASLRLDTLFSFDIPQGRIGEVRLIVPRDLNVTQVRGEQIRDWRIEPAPAPGVGAAGAPAVAAKAAALEAADAAPAGAGIAAIAGADAERVLVVTLIQPQAKRYDVQVIGEAVLPRLPATVELPVVRLAEPVRTSGQVAIGTDSAIKLVVRKSSGLSQIDPGAFARQQLRREEPRPMPSGSGGAFYYDAPTGGYAMTLAMEDVVPAFDAEQQVAAVVKEDDLSLVATIGLEVRDAPLRSLTLRTPVGFTVAAVDGPMVDDFAVTVDAAGDDKRPTVSVRFKQPVTGATLLRVTTELGRSPLGAAHAIGGFAVVGADHERGTVVIAGDEGVELSAGEPTGLREVHTGSVPVAVAGAQQAWRFREPGWSLSVAASRRPSGVRAEAFSVVSIGEQAVYGSVAINYFISGAPIDELTFSIPAGLDHVEFVGADVRRWTHDGDRWTVTLSRKVLGDYNLGVVYSKRYAAEDAVPIAAVELTGVDTRTGYVVVASHLNLKLEDVKVAGRNASQLTEISREEVPATYRLLVNAPVLRTYKYLGAPHTGALSVHKYRPGELIPVVTELVTIDTQLNVDEAGKAETITTVTYKVKNATAQHLPLSMPAGATVWSTDLIETDESGVEHRTRLTASQDEQRKLLLIPLDRKRNPNAPATIELRYAVSHGPIGGSLTLTAPQTAVRSTFADWRLGTTADWSLHPAGGNMLAERRTPRMGSMASVLGAVGGAWGGAIERVGSSGAALFGVLLIAGVALVVFMMNRRAFGVTLVLMGAVTLAVIGLLAADSPTMWRTLGAPDDLTGVQFTQPLTLDDAEALTVTLDVTPAWRQHATWIGTFIVPLVAIGLLVGGVLVRRARPVLWAAAVVAMVYAASQFDVIRTQSLDIPVASMLGHLLTWVLPVALPGYAAVRIGRRLTRHRPGGPVVSPTPAAAAAMIALAAMLSLGSTARADPGVINLSREDRLDRVDVSLTAEPDSMIVVYRLRLTAGAPVGFPLLATDAVLTGEAVPADGVRVVSDGGRYRVVFQKPGAYDVTVKLVAPLAPAGGDLSRSFTMALPPALSARAQLTVPRGGLSVEAPGSVRFTSDERGGSTVASAMFTPGDPVRFNWKPRARQTQLERTVFFAELTSAIRFDTARAHGVHLAKLQIAQGELRQVRITVPDAMTVTAIDGADIGAWRFDPATHVLEVRLTKPAVGSYDLRFDTQMTGGAMPWPAKLTTPIVQDAARQVASLGVLTTSAVFVELITHPQTMNGDDFARSAAGLLRLLPNVTGANHEVRHAFRTPTAEDAVDLKVHEVKPEVRTTQNAAFTVEDDRLALNTRLLVSIQKAGLFGVELTLPASYDIDALAAPQISHWDEAIDGEVRRVTVHFAQKTTGDVPIDITLSRPIASLPKQIEVPQIAVNGSVKHAGQLVVQAERGVRLNIAARSGVSELNPAELGLREQGALAVRLLQPDWSLSLGVEALEPRITADFLHLAEVSEGIVRHHHEVRFTMANAGAKVFEIEVPRGVLGLTITGPDIANTKLVDEATGRWRIELARKYFDRPLPLSIRYETRFDLAAGELMLAPVRPLGADLYRGHVAVRTGDRVELRPLNVGPELSPADSRAILERFPGASATLADAVYTWTTTTPDYALKLHALSHDRAAQLGAAVNQTNLTTVVNERGQSITRVELLLRVGAKRHLRVHLPRDATIWSLMVNKRPVTPSLTADAGGEPVTLVPLAHASGDELDVRVELTYVLDRPKGWRPTRQSYDGPRFDLPLNLVRWEFYLPEGFDYDDFTGTLAVDPATLRDPQVVRYGLATYQEQQDQRVQWENQWAIDNIAQARELAASGKQQEAKAALSTAYQYSYNDSALNEDARVQLQRLNRQQAMVGLKSRRGVLRPGQPGGGPNAGDELNGEFSQQDADRQLAQLDRADSENLEKIANQLIAAQDQAAGDAVALTIDMPVRGRVIAFTRPLQVEPNSPMHVAFSADRPTPPQTVASWQATASLFALLAGLFTLTPWVTRKATRKLDPA